MQRYKNIYTDERPNELEPTCQIQYNLKTKRQTEKNKIMERIIWLILNAKKNKIKTKGVIIIPNALSDKKE